MDSARRGGRIHERWVRRMFTVMGLGALERRNERTIAVEGRRIDLAVDFRSGAPPEALGRMTPFLRGRRVGFDFSSRGMTDDLWLAELAKAALFYAAGRAGARSPAALVAVCVGTTERALRTVRQHMAPAAWRSGAWRMKLPRQVDYWVIDTERLPAGKGTAMWRLLTRVDRLRDGRIAQLVDDIELPVRLTTVLRERVMEALEEEGHVSIFEMTAQEIERRGIQRGIEEGIERGRRAALLRLARALLPAERVRWLEAVEDVEALEEALVADLRHAQRSIGVGSTRGRPGP